MLQGLYDTWERIKGRLSRTTTRIVQQDDMSVFMVYTINDTLIDLVGCNVCLPVIRVDRLSHKEVIPTTCHNHWPYLFMFRWVGISIIRRTEEDSTMSCHTLYQHSCQLQLCIRAAVGVLNHVMVGEGVVTNGVAILIYLLYQWQILLHLQSHHEERCRDIILLQRT